ncbi:DUF3574 domain-containing protein, partial [Desulfococcaceae bacterium HSG8]|nr:DUF3574 domain-containing protein [Desulfococcaceae bacterium HSG8]
MENAKPQNARNTLKIVSGTKLVTISGKGFISVFFQVVNIFGLFWVMVLLYAGDFMSAFIEKQVFFHAILIVAVIDKIGMHLFFRLSHADMSSGNAAGHTFSPHSDTSVKTDLYFGLGKPDGEVVSESEWKRFSSRHITPKFKKGLSIKNAEGQWMTLAGKIINEKSKILTLMHEGDEDTNLSIEKIIDTYKRH